MLRREHLLQQCRRVYRSYGYAPIDTPALEYTEILLGKGGEETDKQLYRFTDHGGRDVALRFDLTVPFARFAAQHITEYGTPFKRYHLGLVWRGERAQRGRYREFMQCDFDTIGVTSNAADIEVALVIYDLMHALGLERFSIRLNNRLVLTGLLEALGLAERSKSVLIALDKLSKIGPDAVTAEMVDKAGAATAQAERILTLVLAAGTNEEILERVRREAGGNERAAEGVRRLSELLGAVQAAGVPPEKIQLDLSIARGLDYYTGTIYETFLGDLPGIGSVCSGGRYDDLASLYTKQKLPGVGASLGLDRLLAALEELKRLAAAATPASVLLVQFSPEFLGAYQRLARALRAEGIGVEVYPEPKKLGQQFAYAEKRGFRTALIAGPDEFAQKVWKIKDLARRQETAVAEGDVAGTIRKLLAE